MADDTQNDSPRSDPVDAKEDADTAAARKELKHTVISDKISVDGATGETTPQGSQNEDRKDHVSSPKKKRGHDQVEEDKDADDVDVKSVASSDSARDRALRLEPEKKRHRDEVTGYSDAAADSAAPSTSAAETTTTTDATTARSDELEKSEKKETSASAFASSGFAKLATSSASPFGTLGGSTKGSVFSGSASAASPFGALSPSKPAAPPAATPTLSFGSAGAAASPFASVTPAVANGFGSAFGSAFGGALGGKPLTSFAKTGESPFKSEKPAKPFGAPDSDAEDGSDEEAEDEADAEESADKEEREESDREELKAADDKKRAKLQKITVDDGEAGEATILQVRAKIFYLEKEVGWKERGSGMLKINVPEACVQFDDAGLPIPGSFDASGLEGDSEDPEAGGNQGHKVARLIMRQDQTHRILLNTVILPAMKFQEKETLKTVGVMFTAFEGAEAKPVSVHVRMSAASAKSFLNEVGMIQRELSGN
ncbi:Nucleoporin NUP56 [Colletotrichum chlorophyti]|uniref:Nucleoporin NUP56 n=1 Tax=Colletotrichum chlorophyti TaxID=708187 RepID=A0A1Q8S2P6_9PEZI|nr:Nucleoporin NUP56 [Colletotrichum chlorophyti]